MHWVTSDNRAFFGAFFVMTLACSNALGQHVDSEPEKAEPEKAIEISPISLSTRGLRKSPA